ncbi:MAG TPA: hypothetical protein VGG89_15285 [Candidatus Baltobacteraceae bacterium]
MSLALIAAIVATTAVAAADQPYTVSGQDVYRIGASQTTSRVTYDGTETLIVAKQGKGARFEAQAHYVRSDAGGKHDATARFIQELRPGGTFEDSWDEDPDFLTILNQPFAVQLDRATMRDLLHLHASVPFNATSPLGGDAVLRGYLRPGTGGEIAGRPAVAVRFEAAGPMSGGLPGGHATMSGKMRLDGIAYYALDDALLLALDATLTIHAQLSESAQAVPVQITYRRYIRARERELLKTPLPAQPGAGAGTAFLPAR